MEKQFLFSQSCCTIFPGPRKRSGSRTELGCTSSNLRSRSPLDTQCAHQLLDWKHVGSTKQSLSAAVVEVLICSVVFCLAAPCARDALAVSGSGLHVQLHSQDTTREDLCRPSASSFPGLSSCSWTAFSVLGRNLLSTRLWLLCFADIGSGVQNFTVWRQPAQSVTAYALIADCLEKSSLKRLNENNLRISFNWVIMLWKKNVNLVPPVAVLGQSQWLPCFKKHKSMKEKQLAFIISEAAGVKCCKLEETLSFRNVL